MRDIDLLLNTVTIEDKNQVIALYTLYFAQYHTLVSISTKFYIVKYYLHDVALLSTNARLIDPIINIYSKYSDSINKIIKEIEL